MENLDSFRSKINYSAILTTGRTGSDYLHACLDNVPGILTFSGSVSFYNFCDNLTFECLDIATDSLPTADIVLIRQVLQHLSNKEVQSIISKLSAYKYVILTEHLPNGSFEPNKDIISGQGIRLKKQSGLNLLIPPFNLKIKKEKQLLSTSLKEGKEVIVTTLYEMS